MKNYSSKKIGEISNGQDISFKDKNIPVDGIWNNTKVVLADADGDIWADENEPTIFLKGDVMNGTMYDATLFVHKNANINFK